MSRHVTLIAGRGRTLLQTSSHNASTAVQPALVFRTISFTPGSRIATRAFASRPLTYQYATAPDTSALCAVTARVALQRPLSELSSHPNSLSSLQRIVHKRWQVQKRFRTDDSISRREASSAEAQKAQHVKQDTVQRKGETPGAGLGAAAGASGKHLLNRLPHLHRPTKEELLAAATGFWHRLQIRFKWFSIRSVRPFNADEVGAFLSWIFWGHVLWIVIGTTTFVSLAIWAVNTVFAQETVAGWVGNYLTKSSGIKVVFEKAIVPTWKDGVITFNNVFVSRRPRSASKRERAVSKGSSTTAAAAAAAEAEAAQLERTRDATIDDGNYTQFDVTIDTVNVTLSFAKWFNGKGLLRDVEVRGVRGVLDRTSVHPTGEVRDPKSYRHTHNTGDFEIDNFRMEDVLLTVYQPKQFRPFTVSVFSCELPRLRKQWLFYDFMSANNMSGSFDDSLFTIHPRQVHGTTGVVLADGSTFEGEEGKHHHWKKHSRFRIDHLNIDHLNRGVEGPFSWIHEGNVDIVADVMIPDDEDGSIVKVMSDLYDRVEATVTQQAHNAQQSLRTTTTETTIRNRDVGEGEDDQEVVNSPAPPSSSVDAPGSPPLILDINVHLNDVRASVPIFTKDLSYVNNALVRPMIAYLNSRRALIPISCRVVKYQAEFDGSWTIFDSGLLDDLSREAYEALARDIVDARARRRRIKKVGLWTMQVAAQALFLGLAGQLA